MAQEMANLFWLRGDGQVVALLQDASRFIFFIAHPLFIPWQPDVRGSAQYAR